MTLTYNNIEITLVDESEGVVNGEDVQSNYTETVIKNLSYRPSAAIGVVMGDTRSPITSCLVVGFGGASVLNSNSASVIQDILCIGVGDSLFAFSLPALKQIWIQQVDLATCFGVFPLNSEQGWITWGEFEVCRVDLNGNMVWTTSGMDIFTEDFKRSDDTIWVTDFNGLSYEISIETGETRLISDTHLHR